MTQAGQSVRKPALPLTSSGPWEITPSLSSLIGLMGLMCTRIERDEFQSPLCHHGHTAHVVTQALGSDRSHAWRLMLYSCCLEILSNFIFALVFCQKYPMGVCTKGLKPCLTHGPTFLGKVLGHFVTSATLCHQQEPG